MGVFKRAQNKCFVIHGTFRKDLKVQCKPLIVITFGPNAFDYNNRMITVLGVFLIELNR
jgi:hypothetical protein